MPTECCVPLCGRMGGHLFPKVGDRRRSAWIKAVRRGEKNWQPSRHSVVCKGHSEASDYVTKTSAGTVPLQQVLKPTAVPHVFPWNSMLSSCAVQRSERVKRRQIKNEEVSLVEEAQRLAALEDLGAEEEIAGEIAWNSRDDRPRDVCSPIKTRDASVQTTWSWFCVEKFMGDPEGIHFYTGLECYGKFEMLLDVLGPAAYELNYYSGSSASLSTENQLFLTLTKLRQHKTDFELSRLFEISEKAVANVYITWINFMAVEFEELDWWPSKEEVKFFMPQDFKSKFPSTRIILDGAECPIIKPKKPIAQQGTFSSYKNRNTAKIIAGSSPGGLVSYVSPAYGGASSDRQIMERSELLHMCDPGDSVMVDKGFNIQDLFIPSQVLVNIPTFFKKTNRLSGSVVLKDRKIASKRVHIERIIGLAKTYKILQQPMNNTESSLATKIIKICFMLCNFRNCIVSNYALPLFSTSSTASLSAQQ